MVTQASQDWTTRQERGSVATIRLMVFVALKLGRQAARLLLYPICAYFFLFSTAARDASRIYLGRVLGRPARFSDVYRHYHSFASCVLDRVFLLNDQVSRFDLHIEGEEIMDSLVRDRRGCLLFGAHLGSFEILRAIGRRREGLRVSLVMYEENARKINTVLNAINPNLSMDIISLGQPDAMIKVGERLDEGGFVGVLADRTLNDEEQAPVTFLGVTAHFPTGPFRMAVLMKRPVIFMVGLYRGGQRYDIHFEKLFDPSALDSDERMNAISEAMTNYVRRLEHYCRSAPYNWFNFYDVWR